VKLPRALTVVCLVGFALSVTPGKVLAQFTPDPRMTVIYGQYLRRVASKNGMAFVSACAGPGSGETEILVVPLGSKEGTLELLANHESYNGAGIKFEGRKPTLVDPLGGLWSINRLEFIAYDLSKAGFQLMSGEALRNLVALNPTRRCPQPPPFRPPGVYEHPFVWQPPK
jgi:hypothetical protein